MKHFYNKKQSATSEEKGIVMLLALMMGVVLIAGATGLMIRQMMARKIGVYSSYEMMADNAAVNGFNRILGTLNNPSEELGYLFLLDNSKDNSGSNYQWEEDNPDLIEYCTNTSTTYLPTHRSGSDWYWPTGRDKDNPSNEATKSIELSHTYTIGEDVESTTTLLNGGANEKRGIEPSFKLRSYKVISFDQNKGQGKGIFEVEGIVHRMSEEGSKNEVARALMTRYIDIFSTIDSPKNWAVLAGERINLGPTTIHGDGLMAWVTENKPNNCSSSSMIPQLDRQQTSTATDDPLVWPINRGLPTSVLFQGDGTTDTEPNDASIKRIWSFDDREPGLSADRGTSCTTVACTRAENSITYSSPALSDNGETTNIIKIGYSDICAKQLDSDVCHIYVENMHLSKTKVLIETTGSTSNPRKIVLHLALPKTKPSSIEEGGNIVLKGSAQLCTISPSSFDNAKECALPESQNPEQKNPENLVIASSGAMNPDWYSTASCEDPTNTVSIEGNTLPSAWLAMAQGSVNLSGNTTLHGAIWARSICSKNHNLKLYATSDTATTKPGADINQIKNASYVHRAAQAWDWNRLGFRGFGKTTLRGLRGDGLDTFQRF